ncbi:hypothetical protein PAPHI01_1474 [Pancytospora philotis]|nr:hypothetical protein PAPHI01_1474 [Pancytospora philotis]
MLLMLLGIFAFPRPEAPVNGMQQNGLRTPWSCSLCRPAGARGRRLDPSPDDKVPIAGTTYRLHFNCVIETCFLSGATTDYEAWRHVRNGAQECWGKMCAEAERNEHSTTARALTSVLEHFNPLMLENLRCQGLKWNQLPGLSALVDAVLSKDRAGAAALGETTIYSLELLRLDVLFCRGLIGDNTRFKSAARELFSRSRPAGFYKFCAANLCSHLWAHIDSEQIIDFAAEMAEHAKKDEDKRTEIAKLVAAMRSRSKAGWMPNSTCALIKVFVKQGLGGSVIEALADAEKGGKLSLPYACVGKLIDYAFNTGSPFSVSERSRAAVASLLNRLKFTDRLKLDSAAYIALFKKCLEINRLRTCLYSPGENTPEMLDAVFNCMDLRVFAAADFFSLIRLYTSGRVRYHVGPFHYMAVAITVLDHRERQAIVEFAARRAYKNEVLTRDFAQYAPALHRINPPSMLAFALIQP